MNTKNKNKIVKSLLTDINHEINSEKEYDEVYKTLSNLNSISEFNKFRNEKNLVIQKGKLISKIKKFQIDLNISEILAAQKLEDLQSFKQLVELETYKSIFLQSLSFNTDIILSKNILENIIKCKSNIEFKMSISQLPYITRMKLGYTIQNKGKKHSKSVRAIYTPMGNKR